MDEQQRRTIRTAAYLAASERHDRRAALSTRTGKTRGKVDCNPPNKRCGNRCIPPSWDCRLEGKGTNSELAAHKTDPLAGIASIQRGAKDLARGVVRLNPSQVQRGRNSVIRGVVKLAPGDNLEQKKRLKRQLTQASTPVMAVIGIGLVGLGAHAGLKRGFGSYRNGLGADIDRAAARAVDSVLDRVPGVSNIRAARRAAGVAATTEIAQAVQRGGGIEAVRSATSGNTGKIGPLSFRPLSADTEASYLRDNLSKLKERASSGSLSYDAWKQEAVQTLYGAQSPGTRARGQRGSIFSEHAANEFLVSKFQLNPTGAVGPRGGYSMAARNALIDTQLTEKLQGWGQALRNDMTLRRYVGPNGAIRDTDVDRYIRELGSSTLGSQLAGLSSAQRNQAVSEAHRLMRSAINGTNLNREARAMRRDLVSQFDTYFENVARSMQRNAAASDSPFGDGMTGLARYISRQQGQSTQILSRDHADLILRNHFHSRVMELKNDFAIGDATARRVAQQLSRSADLPDADSAYRILNENGFSRLSRGGPTTGRKPTRLRNLTELTRDILARPGNEGMTQAAAQREARRIIERRGRSDADDGLIRTATYLAARADLKEGSRLGKPCGESHIPKSHECRKGQSTAASTESTERKGFTARRIAVALVVGSVGAVAVAAANDAYQLSHGLGLPATPGTNAATKPFMKGKYSEVGPQGVQEALTDYYDSLVKQEGWRAGDLVYARTKNEPTAHFAIYMGKVEGNHRFVQMGADGIVARSGGLEISEFGPGVTPKNRSSTIFNRAPSKLQPKARFSEVEINQRIRALMGTPLKYDTFDSNCETWARMIVSGESRSTQSDRLSQVGKLVIRTVYGGLEKAAALDPNWAPEAIPSNTMSAKVAARWLELNNPRGRDGGFMHWADKSRKDSAETDALGLVDPSTVIKPEMSDLEATSAAKRWLMVLTVALHGRR